MLTLGCYNHKPTRGPKKSRESAFYDKCDNCLGFFWWAIWRKETIRKFCTEKCSLLHRSSHQEEYHLNSKEFWNNVRPKVSGENHHSYKGGSYSYRQKAVEILGSKCQNCGSESDIHIHHIDFNHSNNPIDGSNWQVLCRSCHSTAHDFTKNFKGKAPWQKKLNY